MDQHIERILSQVPGWRGAEAVAVAVFSCHPERSEGSLCPASQTLPLRGVYP